MKALIKVLVVGVIGAGIGIGVGRMMAPSAEPPPKTPFGKLQRGNEHFIKGKLTHPNQDPETRQKLAYEGQAPMAVVVTCSDSRVPPELIFDRGLGELFVVRCAGNVVDAYQIASIEYAVEHLGVPLLIVLGHSECGAVKACVAGKPLEGHLPQLMHGIEPALKQVKATHPHLKDKKLVERVIAENVSLTLLKLYEQSEIVQERMKRGKLEVAGGVYNLCEGTIEWLKLPEAIAFAEAKPEKASTSHHEEHSEKTEHPTSEEHTPQHADTHKTASESGKHSHSKAGSH
ncbi:MAG: carbonic anhydrase [Fimbriimonadales bacterium]